jgi:hypothetical protein
MTEQQRNQLRELIHAVEAIRRAAEGSYLPFEVAAAIERADLARLACYEIAWASPRSE